MVIVNLHKYYVLKLKSEGGIRSKVLPGYKLSPHNYLLIKMKKQRHNSKTREVPLDKVTSINPTSNGTMSQGVSPD